MSKIYNNFGVDTTYTERDGKFGDVSASGEKIHVVDRDIDIINRSTKLDSDTVIGGKTHLRDQVFADFQSSGYTHKLSTFYANTFFELSKTDKVNPTNYYTVVTETVNTFEYQIKSGGVYQDTLAYINSTLPNSVLFKVEKPTTINKFVDPLIRI